MAASGGEGKNVRSGLTRSAVAMAASYAVLPLTSLITGPVLARVLGPEGRGLLAAVLAPLLLTVSVGAMSIPEATTFAAAKLRYGARRVGFAGVLILLVYGSISGTALYLLAPTLLREAPEAVGMLRTVAWFVPLLMIALMLRALVAGLGRYGLHNFERIVAPTLRLLAVVALAIAGYLTFHTAVWAEILAQFIPAVVLAFYVFRLHDDSAAEPIGLFALIRRLASYGARGAGGVVAGLISWRIDQALLALFVGPAAIGYYAVSVNLAEVPAIVLSSVRTIAFTESASSSDLDIVARMSRVMGFLSLVVSALVIVLAEPIVVILLGDAFQPAVAITRVLVLGTFPLVVERMLGSGLLATDRPGLRSLGPVVAAVLTLVGLFVLVPRYGAIGAAYVSLIAYTVKLVVTAVALSRTGGVPVGKMLIPSRTDFSWMRGQFSRIRR